MGTTITTNWDNVVLAPAPPAAIPTLVGTGLALLACLVAAAGVWLLRSHGA